MPHTLAIRRPGAAPTRIVLSSPLVAGGSRADGLLLAGAPPAALRLVPAAAGVVVEATSQGVRANGHAVPPGGRRLLRAGQRIELQGVVLEVERARREDDGTRAAAGALLLDAASGADPVPGPCLVILTGPSAGDRHALADGRTLGRGRSAGIRIHDPGASRVHARLRFASGETTIEDLRSKNGLRVNGVRVDRRPCPIRPGDEILVGDTALALEDPGAAPGTTVTPAPARPRARTASARVVAAVLLALSAAALALAAP